MKKKISWVILSALLFSTALWGQNAGHEFQKRSTITVTVLVSSMIPLNCTTSLGTGIFSALSWTFGATTPVTGGTGGGGSSTGKTTFSDLVVTKRTDSCTPLLFAAVAEGKHFPKVTIVQQDNNKDDVFSVTLEDVVIANYELGGDISQEVPSEKIAFNFAKILITDTITGTKFGWDLKQGRTF